MNFKAITTMKLIVLLFLSLSLAAGFIVAAKLNSVLNIRFESKELPAIPIYSECRRSRQASSSECVWSLTQTQNRPALRIVDEGAVGIRPDWGTLHKDYSLNTRAFEHVLLPNPPFVDPTAFAEVEKEFHEYVLRMLSYGYNGIVLPGFLEFVDFACLNGDSVYSPDQSYLGEHEALRQNFSRLFQFAKEREMKVFLSTDMVALTPPLKAYFKRRFGKIDVHRSEFWQIYRLALEELFARLPAVDGLMIRIGEAGGSYNSQTSVYSSELLVRDPESLQLMLTELLPVFERLGKTLIFRTWSVGVGKIGDMHTNPETYLAVLSGITSKSLVVSTKYCMGDFDSFLPLNPTLMIGPQRRIVEFQSRREFEGFDAFPNYMGPLYQTALLEILERNKRVDGVWNWTQTGGPLRAGPVSLYLFHGFWQMVDANVYATARVLERPNSDMIAVTSDWVSRTYGPDQPLNDQITQLLLESHSIVEQGLYIRPFAEKRVLALGLEPPPMLWIFKWNLVDGSSSALSAIYFLSRSNEQFATAVGEGDVAVARIGQWSQRLASLKDRVPAENRANFSMLLKSLDYELDLFETLSKYRRAFLYFYRWLDRGEGHAYDESRESSAKFEDSLLRHQSTYGNNPDFPAYNFFGAEAGLIHAHRTRSIVWLSRITLLICLAALIAGTRTVNRQLPNTSCRCALSGLIGGLLPPWRAPELELDKKAALILLTINFGASLVTMALFTSFASPCFIAGVFGSLVSFALASKFALATGCIHRQRGTGLEALIAPAFSPLIALSLLFLAPLSLRGPLYFWYKFWTSPNFRTIFTVVYVFEVLWLFFSIWSSGARIDGTASQGARALRAIAATGAGLGAALIYLGLLLGLPGLENSLTAVNDEMALLPSGLSRILGITTHLNIPLSLPLWLVAAGATIMVPALLMYVHTALRKNLQTE